MRKFEIYDCGDPYSKAWDCTEYKERAVDSGFFRGDLGHRFTKRGLIAHLRKEDPNAEIVNRDSGRHVVAQYRAFIKAPHRRVQTMMLGVHENARAAMLALAKHLHKEVSKQISRTHYILDGAFDVTIQKL